MAKEPELTEEQKKAAGQTDAQKELRAYHEGAFQTHDPITGEERDLDAAPPAPARLDRGETVEDAAPAENATPARKVARKRGRK